MGVLPSTPTRNLSFRCESCSTSHGRADGGSCCSLRVRPSTNFQVSHQTVTIFTPLQLTDVFATQSSNSVPLRFGLSQSFLPWRTCDPPRVRSSTTCPRIMSSSASHRDRRQAQYQSLGSSQLSLSTRSQRTFCVLLFFRVTSSYAFLSAAEIEDPWRWTKCVLAGAEVTQPSQPLSSSVSSPTDDSQSEVLTHSPLHSLPGWQLPSQAASEASAFSLRLSTPALAFALALSGCALSQTPCGCRPCCASWQWGRSAGLTGSAGSITLTCHCLYLSASSRLRNFGQGTGSFLMESLPPSLSPTSSGATGFDTPTVFCLPFVPRCQGCFLLWPTALGRSSPDQLFMLLLQATNQSHCN